VVALEVVKVVGRQPVVEVVEPAMSAQTEQPRMQVTAEPENLALLPDRFMQPVAVAV
jgi:hypothetical protein